MSDAPPIVVRSPGSDGLDVNRTVIGQTRETRSGRPYVFTNMVVSADGATTIDGGSAALGGPADRLVFSALRGAADVIVAGAGTVRAERYRPPQPSEAVRAIRLEYGMTERAALAVVSGSGDLDPSLPLFGEAGFRPILIVGSDADDDALDRLEGRADIHRVDTATVSARAALAVLQELGYARVLLEGGPTLNGEFVGAEMVDEWNLSIAPRLVGGDALRAAVADSSSDVELVLGHVWQGDQMLFVQWLKAD